MAPAPPIRWVMALDLLALVLLVAFAWRGARRGALATGLSLFAIVAGYGAAWIAATRAGDLVAAQLGVPVLLGAPLAGTAAFVAVGLVIGLVSWLLRRGAEGKLGVASRVGGACFGVLRGSLVVLLIGLLSVWLDAWQRFSPGGDPSEPAATSPLRDATQLAVAAGVEAALGDAPGAGLAANALSRPGEAMEQLRTLAAKPEIAALTNDRELWSYVESGAYDAALAQSSFQRVQWNGELRRELAAAGVVDEIAAGDPAVFALEVRSALAAVGPRLRAVREDPELARLASDPAVADLLQRHDVVGLLAHPGFQRVLSRALAPEPSRG